MLISSTTHQYCPDMKIRLLPDLEYLQECFDLTDSGVLTWKVRPLSHFESVATCNSVNSRLAGKVINTKRLILLGGSFNSVRVVWKLRTGEDPIGVIKSVDGDPLNWHINNLCKAGDDLKNARNIMLQPESGLKISALSASGSLIILATDFNDYLRKLKDEGVKPGDKIEI